jgi:DNA replication protein DnaC
MEHISEVVRDYQQNIPTRRTIPNLKQYHSTEKENQDIYARLRVNPENTLENFKALPGTENAVRAVKGIINSERAIAFIYGGVGNGKTHLLHAAAIELHKLGYFTRVYLYADLLGTLKKSISNQSMDYNEILDRYCFAERLIIDDIGAAGTETEFSDRILENIVCTRYERHLLTIMSTNRDINALPERVVSRLKDKTICYLVKNAGKDYRPQKTLKRVEK